MNGKYSVHKDLNEFIRKVCSINPTEIIVLELKYFINDNLILNLGKI
jgi:hypothetical protein